METQGLERTGKFAGGLKQDIKRRLKYYVDDYVCGFHPKVTASAIFLFFACLANAVAFGLLTAEVTGGAIGTTEMLIVTAIGGIAFAIFSGQPLTILGGTGPIVIFTGLLYTACESMDVAFLPTYAWVGIWSGVFLVILAVTDASFLMKYFTRFTDEIFAALIAVIFIVEAIEAVVHPFSDASEGMGTLDTAFLTLVLALGTYTFARGLIKLRKSPYLRWTIREFMADFGPAIAIIAMTVVGVYFGDISASFSVGSQEVNIGTAEGVALAKPEVPETFGTTSGRPWVVDLFAVPVWVWFASTIPAAMATILLFLDQNITTRLVNASQNKLLKGPGFHLDLLVVGIITLVASLFGLPWIVAATVHALNHVKSLATTEVQQIGGEPKDVITHVRENRVSALSVHILIGLSLLALPLVKLVPNAVLFGLFLYMGVTTLGGNEFFERIRLWITDPKLFPKAHYLKRIPRTTIHSFTFIQLLGLLSLWVMKTSKVGGFPLGIFFPILIALLVPLRMGLGRFYDSRHLALLDAEEMPEDDEDDWSL